MAEGFRFAGADRAAKALKRAREFIELPLRFVAIVRNPALANSSAGGGWNRLRGLRNNRIVFLPGQPGTRRGGTERIRDVPDGE